MSLVEVEADKERKGVVGTTDDGQTVCEFYAWQQRMDGYCSFIELMKFVTMRTWISSEGSTRKQR